MWADPDDPLLVVPVAGQPRARRLRDAEEECELTGGAFCANSLLWCYAHAQNTPSLWVKAGRQKSCGKRTV